MMQGWLFLVVYFAIGGFLASLVGKEQHDTGFALSLFFAWPVMIGLAFGFFMIAGPVIALIAAMRWPFKKLGWIK